MGPAEFLELRRYMYDLSPTDLVVDAGGYEGAWAQGMSVLYDPRIVIYEPVPRFADLCRMRHRGNPKVEVRQSALSTVTGRREFRIVSNDSGFYVQGTRVDVECVDVAEVVTGEVGLLKLNIEAEEYNVLERMLDSGVVGRVRDIQVQFHRDYDDAEDMRFYLRRRLAHTHRLTWDYPFVWENWRRNE